VYLEGTSLCLSTLPFIFYPQFCDVAEVHKTIWSDLAIKMKSQEKNPCIFLATYCNLVYNLAKKINQKSKTRNLASKKPRIVFCHFNFFNPFGENLLKTH
jgi:hypothetical protein